MRTPAEEHLRLLAIFHWILAAFSLLFCAIPVVYAGIGFLFLSGTIPDAGKGPPPAFGWLFVIFGLIGLLLAASYTTLLVLSARALSARRRWLLVLVTAGLSCALFPMGTVLGAFTFAVLLRPDVRVLFGQAPGWGYGPPPGPPPMPPPPAG